MFIVCVYFLLRIINMQQIQQKKESQEHIEDNLMLSLGVFDIKLNTHIHTHQDTYMSAGLTNCESKIFSREKFL